MRVVQVYSPFQDSSDTSGRAQCIDGEFPSWCVKSERVPDGQSYQQWLRDKAIQLENHSVLGIYLYDIMPTPLPDGKVALIIRYDYIKAKA